MVTCHLRKRWWNPLQGTLCIQFQIGMLEHKNRQAQTSDQPAYSRHDSEFCFRPFSSFVCVLNYIFEIVLNFLFEKWSNRCMQYCNISKPWRLPSWLNVSKDEGKIIITILVRVRVSCTGRTFIVFCWAWIILVMTTFAASAVCSLLSPSSVVSWQ